MNCWLAVLFLTQRPVGGHSANRPLRPAPTQQILEAGIALGRKTLELDSALKYTSNPSPSTLFHGGICTEDPAPRAPFGIGLSVDSTQFTHTCLYHDTIGRYRKIEARVKY